MLRQTANLDLKEVQFFIIMQWAIWICWIGVFLRVPYIVLHLSCIAISCTTQEKSSTSTCALLNEFSKILHILHSCWTFGLFNTFLSWIRAPDKLQLCQKIHPSCSFSVLLQRNKRFKDGWLKHNYFSPSLTVPSLFQSYRIHRSWK